MTIAKPLPIAAPAMDDSEAQAVIEVLNSGWLTQGPRVARFEAAFAKRHNVEHALATTSCTTALQLALAALRIGPGDEVIVPSFTWVATANVVVHAGATPVIVDVKADTYNIDAEAAARAVTPRTKAVVAVHLFGLCADIMALRAALPDHVTIIEDAACAIGSEYNGVPAGGLGDIACFSFHPRKTVTCGEGGMLTSNNAALAKLAKILRNHGGAIPEEIRNKSAAPFEMPQFEEIGFNFRMTDIQAAVAHVQFDKLDRFIGERKSLAAVYDKLLSRIDWISTPHVPNECGHSWQAYVALINPSKAPITRDELLRRLYAEGISGRAGTHSIASLDVYQRRFGAQPNAFPVSTMLEGWTLALPLHNKMTEDDVARVHRRDQPRRESLR